MVGWWMDIDALKSILPKLISMKFNTALGFVACGVMLVL